MKTTNKFTNVLVFLTLLTLTFNIANAKDRLTESFDVANDKDKLTESFNVELNGEVGRKMNASYNNRILAQDAERLIKPFTIRDEHSCWQGDRKSVV